MVKLRRLSDFEGEEANAVVCDILPYIGDIISKISKEQLQEAEKRNNLAVVSALFGADNKAMLKVIERLADGEVDVSKLKGNEVAEIHYQLGKDTEFFSLFGLRSGTEPSSGSAPENTEGEPSEASSNTANAV